MKKFRKIPAILMTVGAAITVLMDFIEKMQGLVDEIKQLREVPESMNENAGDAS